MNTTHNRWLPFLNKICGDFQYSILALSQYNTMFINDSFMLPFLAGSRHHCMANPQVAREKTAQDTSGKANTAHVDSRQGAGLQLKG
jgi:hypothetical protein